MLPDRMQGWSSSREEQNVRVGACSSPALGATIADLLLLWRAKQARQGAVNESSGRREAGNGAAHPG